MNPHTLEGGYSIYDMATGKKTDHTGVYTGAWYWDVSGGCPIRRIS